MGAIRRIARTQGRRKPEKELEFKTGTEKETAERKRQTCKTDGKAESQRPSHYSMQSFRAWTHFLHFLILLVDQGPPSRCASILF